MQIGFIGLGIMGKPMSKNLLRAGYSLSVANRSQESVRELAREGAAPSGCLQIAETCDIIFTMLPNSPEVKEVVLDEKGLYSRLHKGQILVDMSCINPIASREIAECLAKKGVEMLDAPVSGGEPKAIDGTLSFMVGGKKEIFDQCRPILLAMGNSAVYCGKIGAGNIAKVANQVIVAANIAALAEGLMLAKRAGVDPSTIFSAIRGGLAGSAVMEAKAPMMINNNTAPGFKIDLHVKDLNNAMDTAKVVESPLPLTEIVFEMLESLQAKGFGQCDHSALAKYYELLSGDVLYQY